MELYEATILFPGPSEVWVDVASPNGMLPFDIAVLFATLYEARQLRNLGRKSPLTKAIACELQSIDDEHPLAWCAMKLGAVKGSVGMPPSGADKGFRCKFSANPFDFKLDPVGFGMLARGIEHYAPTSIYALLAYLFANGNDRQKRRLMLATKTVADAALAGEISLTNQAELAYRAALNAIEQVDSEPDEEASAVDRAYASLSSLLTDMSELHYDGGAFQLPIWATWQMVNEHLLKAAGLYGPILAFTSDAIRERTEEGMKEYGDALVAEVRKHDLVAEARHLHAQLFQG